MVDAGVGVVLVLLEIRKGVEESKEDVAVAEFGLAVTA